MSSDRRLLGAFCRVGHDDSFTGRSLNLNRKYIAEASKIEEASPFPFSRVDKFASPTSLAPVQEFFPVLEEISQKTNTLYVSDR